MTPRITTIIPAAGASRRLGSPKQLVEIDGESLLHLAARRAIEARLGNVIVVLGSDATRLAGQLKDLACVMLEIGDWQEGMSASIRAGVAHAADDPETAAVLITLVDQWALTSADMQRLAAAWRAEAKPIAAAEYADGTLGVPAIFDRSLFGELTQLSGDAGARRLIRSNPSAVTRVSLPAAAQDYDEHPPQVG